MLITQVCHLAWETSGRVEKLLAFGPDTLPPHFSSMITLGYEGENKIENKNVYGFYML